MPSPARQPALFQAAALIVRAGAGGGEGARTKPGLHAGVDGGGHAVHPSFLLFFTSAVPSSASFCFYLGKYVNR